MEELAFTALAAGPDRLPREAVRLDCFGMEGRSIQVQNALIGRYRVLGDHLVERGH